MNKNRVVYIGFDLQSQFLQLPVKVDHLDFRLFNYIITSATWEVPI